MKVIFLENYCNKLNDMNYSQGEIIEVENVYDESDKYVRYFYCKNTNTNTMDWIDKNSVEEINENNGIQI